MRKFVNKEDEQTSCVSEFKKGIWNMKYFYFYCDRCGAKHTERCVNHVYSEEGFEKESDLCHDYQRELYQEDLLDKSKFHYF